jgi:cell division septation protein DedD
LDPHDREPSYYEVALTHRQVTGAFVILLACLFTAFLAGVWIGRDAQPRAQTRVAESAPPPEPGQGRLEQLTFFGDPPAAGRERSDGTRPAGAPPTARPESAAPPAPTPAESEAEKLRRTLEAEMEANRLESEAPPGELAAPGARLRRDDAPEPAASAPPPAPALAEPSRPRATATPTADPFWIQVYSSTNGERAQEIVSQLRRGGFQARLLEAPRDGVPHFRVRVGPYPSRERAAAAAVRLRREQRLDTWVTDQP